MNEILLYVSSGGIIFAFLAYFIIIILNQHNQITKTDGFNITKDILHEYDSINIIENKGYFTIYNIKRRVVRLTSKNYYGKSVSDIAISLIEAGISAIDNYKNKYINLFRNVLPNLKCLYLLPILSILINHVTYNISDAKVSIGLIGLFAIINYLFITIKAEATDWIATNLKKIKDINKEDGAKVLNFINKVNIFDKIIFISQLIMIIRCVAIILDI